MVNQQEWDLWKQNPVTKVFFKTLEDNIEDFKELWSNGVFSDKEASIKAQAQVKILKNIVGLDYADLEEAA